MLLGFGGCELQLKGHIQGNLHLRNDKDRLLSDAIKLLSFGLSEPSAQTIRRANAV